MLFATWFAICISVFHAGVMQEQVQIDVESSILLWRSLPSLDGYFVTSTFTRDLPFTHTVAQTVTLHHVVYALVCFIFQFQPCSSLI